MSSEGLPHLAARLSHLMDTTPSRSSVKYTAEALAAEMCEAGYSVTAPHLSHLRNGTRDNPSARLVQGLAQILGVPVSYFYDDDVTALDAQLNLLQAVRRSGLETLVTRAQGVSPVGVEALTAMAERLKEIERRDDQ